MAEIVKYKEHNKILPPVVQLTKGRTYNIVQNIIYGLCTEVSIVINTSIKYIDNLHVLSLRKITVTFRGTGQNIFYQFENEPC